MSSRVIFQVSCPTASFEELCVVGSAPELGAWDSARAVPLRTSERLYPIWRTPELLLSRRAGALQYKYLKLGSGPLAQWEVGPSRVLDPACLSDSMVSVVEDVALDVDEDLARRGGARIRFQEASGLAKSQATSLATSRLPSSVPSPLRTSAGQTPVERSPHGLQELEAVLRELRELEPMNLAGGADVQRAIAAVRAAIDAEHLSGGAAGRRAGRCGCGATGCALLAVPLLPLLVAALLLWRVPSARGRGKRGARGGGLQGYGTALVGAPPSGPAVHRPRPRLLGGLAHVAGPRLGGRSLLGGTGPGCRSPVRRARGRGALRGAAGPIAA